MGKSKDEKPKKIESIEDFQKSDAALDAISAKETADERAQALLDELKKDS